jgi:hypothetical protein
VSERNGRLRRTRARRSETWARVVADERAEENVQAVDFIAGHSFGEEQGFMGLIATSYPSLRRARVRIRARCFLALGSSSWPCSINRTPSCNHAHATAALS